MADLPSNMSYCYLKGRLISAVTDGLDANNEPDALPRSELKITVRALLNPRAVVNRAADVEVDMSDIIGRTDSQGRFSDDFGNLFIGFVAPDEDVAPVGGVAGDPWKVTVTITGDGYTTRSKTFIPVANTPETALEWTDIIEAPPSTPGELAIWQQLQAEVEAARAGAEAARDEAVQVAASMDVTDYARLVQLARDPDQIISGAITRNGSDVITSAAVRWPGGVPGTFTTDTIDASDAINAYHITYGSPATKTFTQPTMTRNASGAVTVLPQIVVS